MHFRSSANANAANANVATVNANAANANVAIVNANAINNNIATANANGANANAANVNSNIILDSFVGLWGPESKVSESEERPLRLGPRRSFCGG